MGANCGVANVYLFISLHRIGDIMKIDLIPYHNAQNNVGTSLINNPTPVKQPNFGAASSAPSTSRESALTYKMSNMKMNGVQRR